MKKDYIITFITEFFVLVCGVLVYKLAAIFLGKEGFSEYALSRRTLSLIQPALLIGLGVGIPRYIAFAHATEDSKNPNTYFLSALALLFFVLLIFTLLMNLFKDKFSFLLFGSSNHVYLILPINLMLIGLVIHSSCYSYYRGRLFMFRANVLQIINLGVIPLFSIVIGKNIVNALLIAGLLWILSSGGFLVSIISNLTGRNLNILSHTKELLLYGIQRVPGDFGLAALMTLPATFTAHMAGVEKGGFVAFGISLLNMVGASLAPIGVILLPKASQLIAHNNLILLKSYISKMLKIVCLLTATCIVIFEIFAEEIINLYLGQNFKDLVLVTRVVMIGGLVYAVYLCLRSLMDAYYVKAINTINIGISLTLFIILSGITKLFRGGYIYVLTSLVVALFILGILTLWETRKILNRNVIARPGG